MMKKKLVKIIGSLIIAMGICSVVSIATINEPVSGVATETLFQQSTTLLNSNIKEQYVVGETFVMPDAPMLADGKRSYPSKITLRAPNGKGYTQKEVVLEMAGVYTIEYKAKTVEGKLLKQTETFKCVSTLYNLDGKNIKAEYGAFSEYKDTEEGVKLELTPSSKFSLNKTIDLSTMDNSYEESVAFEPIISFYVAPHSLYTADAKEINIVLTDVYDSSNTVSIAVKKADDVDVTQTYQYQYTYLTAAAPGQIKLGLHSKSGAGEDIYTWTNGDGKTYIINEGNQFGTPARFSMTGGMESDGSYVGKELISIGWDNDEKRVYVQSESNGKITRSIITDLDEPTLYDDFFKGFTTGEVYLSMTASGYSSSSCRMVITQIAGVDQSFMQNNYFEDTVAPSLEIDLLGYQEPPKAIVGKTYPVFKASANDNYDKTLIVNTSVYKNYYKNTPANVSLINGCFTPTEKGVYTIVYTVQDDAGNVTQKTVDITAVDNISEVKISLAEKTDGGFVGTFIPVAPATLMDGSGEHKLIVRAYHNDKKGISYEVDQKNWCFRPLYAGDYTITYSYGDYLETKETSYSITVEEDIKPYIPNDAVFPEYVLKNSKVQIPGQIGYLFENGMPIKKQCQVIVRQDKGDYVLTSAKSVEVTASETFTVIYRLYAGNKFSEVEYVIPVIDAGLHEEEALDITKFFVGDFKAEVQEEYVLFTASGREKDYAEMQFVKSLLAEKFQLEFGTDGAYTGFENIVITLTDSVNKDIVVSFVVAPDTMGKATVKINGQGTAYSLDTDFFTDSSVNHTFYYNNESKAVELTSDLVISIAQDLNGKDFNGFPSHYVDLKVRVNGIENSFKHKAAIRIAKVNNQFFASTETSDWFEPEITTRSVREAKKLGDIQELLPIYAADVLDPYIKLEMKVFDPDGDIVTALDGTVLNCCDNTKTYKIKLEKYGIYSIEYYVEDGAGNSTDYSYIVKVVDFDAPEITLSDLITEGNVGDEIRLADVTVSDNLDDAEDIEITWYIKTPTGRMLSLFADDIQHNAFKAQESGTYTIYCYAFDSAGNYALESYVVTIS